MVNNNESFSRPVTCKTSAFTAFLVRWLTEMCSFSRSPPVTFDTDVTAFSKRLLDGSTTFLDIEGSDQISVLVRSL